MSNLESVLQTTLIAMLRTFYPGIIINLSLNGISLKGLTAQQKAQLIREQKQQGMEPGIMDLVLYLPDGQLLNIELKRPVGGSQSPDQKAIEQKLKSLDHNYHLIRTTDEAFELIAQCTTTSFRESQIALLGIPQTPALQEPFLHWPKGIPTATIQHDLAVLYRI